LNFENHSGLLGSAQAQVSWVASTNGRVPSNAIIAGNERGSQVFVCRGNTNSNLIAGKLVVGFPHCYLPLNGAEIRLSNYDVAVGNGVWRRSNVNTAIPPSAVLVGFTAHRQNTFSCRANHQTYMIAGRVIKIYWMKFKLN
jgi:hypothetical protein